MSTETLGGTKPSIAIADRNNSSLTKSFVNSSGGALVPGQPVYLHTDGTVKTVASGATIPIGVVLKGCALDAERVTVQLFAIMVIEAVIAAATLAGVELESDGAVSSGKPTYSAADAGDYVHAILLKATTGNGQTARIAVISPYQKNA